MLHYPSRRGQRAPAGRRERLAEQPKGWVAVWRAMRTWRTASVTILSFSSGLPLGLVWIAIPTWLAREGVDIKTIGLFTLAQAPWTFKFLWSPLMDRYALPLPRVPRKLGWAILTQLLLVATTLWLAGLARHPDALWVLGAVTLAMAFASASQDIALDAYAVEVLRPEEQGVAVGARTALYRAAMFVAGGLAITVAGAWSWPGVFAVLGVLYLPMTVVSWFSPRSESDDAPPPVSLRAAVWEPFVGFLSTHRALEMLAFVVLYKLADNLAGALLRPFLVQAGFNDFDVGVATATIGLAGTLAGTFLGGMLTTAMGLGRSLWVFGALQILSNFGYVAIATVGVNRPVMYGAMAFETFTTGLGSGAFGVLLLRMTQKRFSATQYALFTSLFAVPRLLTGPVAGVLVDAMGWRDFFLLTMAVGIPGMVMLQRFSPFGVKDPKIATEEGPARPPVGLTGLLGRGGAGAVVGLALGGAAAALLAAMRAYHRAPEAGFDVLAPLRALLAPQSPKEWTQLLGVVLFGLLIGLATAATAAARSGRRPRA
jgi:PAT family beta-lactamase induction signal transducer AmpG